MHIHAIRRAHILLYCWLLTATAHAQWSRTNGPDGGDITLMAASAGTSFAATADSLYRSLDGGCAWTSLPVPSGEITAIAASDTAVMIGTRDGKIYRSAHRGDDWSPVAGPFPDARVATIELRGTLILIGFLDEYAKGRSGLFGSFDGGGTWSELGSGLPDKSPFFAIAASGTSLFLAGDAGVFRSTDNGITCAGSSVAAASLVAASDGRVAAATYDQIYHSTDNGATWSAQTSGLPAGAGIGALIYDDDILLCGTMSGIFRSTDNGATWRQCPAGITSPAVTALVRSNGQLLAGTGGGGVHRSTDRGATWSVSSRGITESLVASILPAGGDLFVGTGGGVYFSPDGGATWSYRGLSGRIYALAMLDGALLAGTSDSGVFRSTDRGLTWRRSAGGLEGRARSIGSLLAVDGALLAGTSDGVYRSTDGGVTWSHESDGIVETLVPVNALAASGNDIYAGLGGFAVSGTVGAVYRATEPSSGWEEVGMGDFGIMALAARYPHVWAGGYSLLMSWQELFRSTDRGATWTRTPFIDDGRPHGVSALLSLGPDLLAGTDAGVFASNDDGITWFDYGGGMPSMRDVTALASDAGTHYAGLISGGVWKRSGSISSAVPRQLATRAELAVVPNPISSVATLRYRVEREGSTRVELRDLLGRVVATPMQRRDDVGEHAMAIDVAGLEAGSYYMTVTTATGVATVPVTIIR